ncbi:microcystinase C [Brevibacillus reuszeri]|uniref:Microcystinase C n=1 Tax=Brevibacillus reuszeri TaxID=54915 RepID=A0A0K9YKR2_9BACL|nr:M81 family metallopeptidase [Brevibacillus reuszeri]KNB69264.1 MlrC domain protein [Brevibacillus reuszeri]MED1860209.1 M81 family metallopeptidase [Brevibacillus reuszeri]GED71592.1 microcystinase C [Brevibacillus reuszeri]
MKMVVGVVSHETNTFSNVPTTVELFKLWEWERGQTILQKHRRVRDPLGGMIDRAEELGIEVIPSFAAFTYPNGTITAETYEAIKQELIEGIMEAGEVDAICLVLHGAGVVEGIDDLEGDLLHVVRQVVGYSVPLIATLDLHGNLSDKMVAEADALLGFHLYPHTDGYERGIEAVDLAYRMVRGECKPVMYLTRLPLMIPTSTTNLSPAKDINEACWKWEKEPGVIDCVFFHGFPYTDIPDVGVSIISVTDGDKQLAKRVADDVARLVWEKREEFSPQILTPAEGIQEALRTEGRPVVINETSDNPGGGSPGDGTHLLRAMLEAKLENACFGFINDPEVARLAHQAGVGATIDVKLGGKTDTLHGEPLSITAYVKSLTDGQFTISSPMGKGTRENYGKSARLQIGGVDVLICSVKSQVLDEQIFLLHGINVLNYKIVGLKSSQHFRAAYEPISARIIPVDSPGLSCLQLSLFQYKRIQRPIFPLDKDTEFVLKFEKCKK